MSYLSKFDDDKEEKTKIEDESSTFEDEDIKLEYSYENKKKMYLGVGAGIVAFIVIMVILYVNSFTHVSDYVGVTLKEAEVISESEKIILKSTLEYSNEFSKGEIISQDIEKGEKVKKGTVLRIRVSDGANMDEEIPLINFEDMTKDQIELWADEINYTKYTLKYEYSEAIAENYFIRNETELGTATTFKRSQEMILVISTGSEGEEEIRVIEHVNQTESVLSEFCVVNELECTVEEEFNELIMSGNIIRASAKVDEKITKSTPFTYVVSKGKGAIVEDHSKYKMNNLPTVEYLAQTVEVYSNLPYGTFISQSVAAGVKIEQDEVVVLTYSKGKVSLTEYKGMPLVNFQEFIDIANNDGANLKYNVTYVDDTEGVGRNIIVSQDIGNVKIAVGTTINLQVTR